MVPSKPRILIVEDEPGIADTLQYALRTDGFEPAWCATGMAALDQLRTQLELDQTVADLVAAVTAPLYGAVSETKALLQSAAVLDLDAQRQAEREAQVRRFRELASLMQD